MKYENRFDPILCVICWVILSAPVSFGMESISPGEVKSSEELPIPDVEKLVIINYK